MKQFVAGQNINNELRGALMQICGKCKLYASGDFEITIGYIDKYIIAVLGALKAGNVTRSGASHLLGHDRDCFYNALKGRYKN